MIINIDFFNFDLFLLKAGLAGIALAVIAGPLGCLLYWKRMTYFGDAISHTALFGVVIGLVFSINISLALIITVLLFSLVLFILRNKITSDSSLTILAQAFLSISLIIIALTKNLRVDLFELILGDILLITNSDLWLILSLSLIMLIWLIILWDKLLITTINTDLAKCYQIRTQLVELQFTLIIALFTALSIKFIGILLISALLIIPATTARLLSNSPEKMAITASIIACIATCCGLLLSFYGDLPSGPAIITSAIAIFVFCLLVRGINKIF